MAIPHARSGEVISLRRAAEPAAAPPMPMTHALLKARQLEVVRLRLTAGKTLPEHAAPGEVTLLGLEGTLALILGQRRLLVGEGDLVHLAAGEPHAVQALEDCSALLTICLQRG